MIAVYLVCVFLFAGISAGPIVDSSTSPEGSSCNSGNTLPKIPLVKAGNKHYYFGIVYKGTFLEAVQYCNYHGMTSVSIESAEKNDELYRALLTFIGDGVYSFWSSGTFAPENHWVWLSTGKPVSYGKWATQPAAQGDKRCLELQYKKQNKALLWGVAACGEARHAICEVKSDVSISADNSTVSVVLAT